MCVDVYVCRCVNVYVRFNSCVLKTAEADSIATAVQSGCLCALRITSDQKTNANVILIQKIDKNMVVEIYLGSISKGCDFSQNPQDSDFTQSPQMFF